ncbi:hypothetical protein [uncultured Pseudomonas sp.]|uniref:hypothetical protein n=1 Tax=uncultured Pseudomonas sp. TaxID=114707 RepID=UPI0030D773BE|tara:strand:- start:22917 stop:23825 length:909 start_codon:yes stop_codon:yes gene_type:complete
MGRTASKGVALVEDAPLNHEVLLAQHNQVAVLNEEQETRVRAVAEQLGYQLPAECTDPDLIQRDIAANMRRSVEACLEVGRGLVVLKTACEHGQFLPRLEVLGIETRVAQKFMASAAKFASLGGSSALTKAIGNQTKLFEMLVLDDEEIQELELTGQTGELSLDDVATMSVKELRKALRETRQDKEAQGRVLADKNARIDELATRLAKQPLIQVPTPDEAAKQLRQEVIGIAFEAEADISGKLREAFATMAAHTEETGTDHRTFQSGLVRQLERLLNDLRAEFQLPESADGTDLDFFQQQDA